MALVANTLVGVYLVIHFSTLAVHVATEIVTGVSGGIPLPLKYRWLLLNQTWLMYTLAAFATAALGTMVNFALAGYVTGSKLEVVALAAVFLGAAVCLAVITAGVFEYAYYRSVLRQAKAG
jgi:hypothetical protein